MTIIRVVVNGAYGKMGRTAVQGILGDPQLELVGAVGRVRGIGLDAGEAAGCNKAGIAIEKDLEACLARVKPDVVIDFTNPAVVKDNIRTILLAGAHAVVGTTGLSGADLPLLQGWSRETGKNVLVAPNFAIGAVLMMKFAQEAARFFPAVEIIEAHNPQKADAPSGTAIKTAEAMQGARGENPVVLGEEKIPGVRGGALNGIPIHSVRLPGYVAHQQVIFGGLGQTLTLRHDSISRESFIPGIVLAVKKVGELEGVVYGFENLLDG
ncbi:MAG: 4-hydroxy-tetrahydrodipicolinate reductase [bacterium]|jgi:4-hydroxy-tetrahydrodipicolinate reductase